MAVYLLADKSDPPLAALVVASIVRKDVGVSVIWGSKTALELPSFTINVSYGICRYLALASPASGLYVFDALLMTEIDNWILFSITPWNSKHDFDKAIRYLNEMLGPITFLAANDLTLADLCVWEALYKCKHWAKILEAPDDNVNVVRWYKFISSLDVVTAALVSIPKVRDSIAKSGKQVERGKNKDESVKSKDEGKFVLLPGAEKGKVVVRFPPEASGYLHIGHAKAALLNQYYRDVYNGKLVMRFDDTNPAKEKVDFEKVILEDLQLLKITPDTFTHTSNYFELMLQFCEKLLHQGLAYADNTDAETMKQEREQHIESKNRNNSIEKNLKMWKEMKCGSELGQKWCIRAKIDMNSVNGCMRDPTIYRCKNEPHPKTGTKYKVYPTYDFACPIVDSVEGVTHCLRTMEYHDRDEQFFWFIDVLELRKPHIWEYSRLNMMNTVLSKRKLTWFVDEGLVDGWDDPRFPTVRGVLRRGMTVEGLKQFIIAQGSSRSVVVMEWDKIWAFNKKVIDPVAPRYTSVSPDNVPVLVKNVTAQPMEVPKHPKDDSIGKKTIWIGPRVLIDREDAETLKKGGNATFINWGNLMIEEINRENGKIVSVEASLNLGNTDYKKTVKLTWLAETEQAPFVPCICVYFDHIISKPILGKDEDFKNFLNKNTRKEVLMLGDPELLKVKKSDIIQLQRRGFFICDSEYAPRSLYSGRESAVVLFYIPDGKAKEMATSGAPKDAAVVQPSKVKPVTITESSASKTPVKPSQSLNCGGSLGGKSEELNKQILAQGDIVRKLKSEKADKDTVTKEVSVLLSLKADFKATTGIEWKPGVQLPATPSVETVSVSNASVPIKDSTSEKDSPAVLHQKIVHQGDKVRQLKSEKAKKEVIDAEVKILLGLKSDFKAATGMDWKPGMTVPEAPLKSGGDNVTNTTNSANVENLNKKILEQGDKVRALKAEKARKELIDAEVKSLLALKADYKQSCGQDWKPTTTQTAVRSSTPKILSGSAAVSLKSGGDDNDANTANCVIVDNLNKKILEQGDKVRALKADKASKEVIEAEVKGLLALKADYKQACGQDWKPNTTQTPTRSSPPKTQSGSAAASAKKGAKTKEKLEKPASGTPAKKSDDKKQTRLGLEATKEENLPEWYSQVITKGELIEYYDVSGCYIYRPWSYAIWEFIKNFFDAEIKKLGVQNCYFPLFVSRSVLEKEKTHIADFAPEVAWVTKSGDTDLAEPIAVRPTSETVMYPAYAKWIQSYRDLPIKLNQWNNVVRWEFKHPQPFLRTREFLWQEGHTAYACQKEAEAEVMTILDLYASIYTDLLAIPVVKGRKTEKEKFAGGDYTTTVEAFISASGRAIQGATSHHLGQNFSKMFDITYEDPETKEKKFVFQNSWGITTRTIGVMIMVHADNQGLVLPPRVASIQIVIVPCGITATTKDDERATLMTACKALEDEIKASGMRVFGDYRDNYSPGWRYNHWELKGVPIRVELGPKDLVKEKIIAVRRDTGEKIALPRQDAVKDLSKLLVEIQGSLLTRAKEDLASHIVTSSNWDEFCRKLDEKNIILSPFCGEIDCEERIKKDSAREDAEAEPGAPAMGAKSLCSPFEQPTAILSTDKCIYPSCKNRPKQYTLFGRSY